MKNGVRKTITMMEIMDTSLSALQSTETEHIMIIPPAAGHLSFRTLRITVLTGLRFRLLSGMLRSAVILRLLRIPDLLRLAGPLRSRITVILFISAVVPDRIIKICVIIHLICLLNLK